MRDEDGSKLHLALDDYGHEGRREVDWIVPGVVKYHRRISTIVNSLFSEGFVLERLLESEAPPTAVELGPRLHEEHKRPPFLILRARR